MWCLLAAFALATAGAFYAHAAEPAPANLLANGDAEAGNVADWPGMTRVTEKDPHSGKFCFEMVGPGRQAMSKEMIPVDAAKTYTLSAWFRAAGEEKSKIFFGYIPFDEKKAQIYPQYITPCAMSDTTLAAACAKTDTVLKVADAAKWRAVPYGQIAFETDDSGDYADLPNSNLSAGGVAKLEQKDEYWEVTLTKPCGVEYPAGTKIRQHLSAGTYIYNGASGPVIGPEWTQCSGSIHGVVKAGAAAKQWWPGTKYVKVVILGNYGGEKDKDYILDVDDITMTVDPEKPAPAQP